MVRNIRAIFNKVPSGPLDHHEVFKYDETSLDIESVPLDGGFLVKVLAVSIDPYMRNRMRPAGISGFAVARVLRSEYSEMPEGAVVYGFMAYQEYVIFASPTSSALGMTGLNLRILENKYNLPWHYFVGVLGMSGQTAYFAFNYITEPKSGTKLNFLSSLAVQYAKMLGMKVISSCGTDEKVKLVKSLGADHVFNYKTQNTGPINVYLDCIGGATLEAVLNNVAMNARVALCGMVSQYENTSNEGNYGVRNLWLMNKNRVRMAGYIVTDWLAKYDEEFFREVPRKLAAGEVTYLSHIHHGLDSVGSSMEEMLRGGNIGKSVVILDESAL
ncbi:hypothetical protein DL96DRAFT_1619606 [Flagelloscypha sp. PMI_526]|nr:hypothetical protein DL96DRAFT_1619606 [Flagelloscypha sp. PMI_526]